MERLDKIIATALQISRKDAIALIKRGRIAVSKETIKDPKAKFDENGAVLFVTRGLGNSGPSFRVFNRPEIAVLTLRRAEG